MTKVDNMKKPSITTIIVIICILIIGLYALTEVNYFSYKQVAESKDVNASVVVIPSLGVFEKINNVSISQGVYIDVTSNIPTKGDTVLYGHRTLQAVCQGQQEDMHHLHHPSQILPQGN